MNLGRTWTPKDRGERGARDKNNKKARNLILVGVATALASRHKVVRNIDHQLWYDRERKQGATGPAVAVFSCCSPKKKRKEVAILERE